MWTAAIPSGQGGEFPVQWLRALVVFSAFPALAAGQAELRGRVLTDSGSPVIGATVTLSGVRYVVRTDSTGAFHLGGTPGSTLSFTISAAGYRDETVSAVLRRRGAVAVEYRLTIDAPDVEAPIANPSDRMLRGLVTDGDGQPIAYATLQVNGGRRFASDDSGRFTVPVSAGGGFTLLLRRIGYSPAEVRLDGMPDTAVRVRMNALATALPGQLVTGRSPYANLDLGGFYQRMQESEKGALVGYFVTPEDLQLRNPVNLTDAVEAFPNIRLRPIDDGQRGVDGLYHGDGVPLNRKMRIENRQGCPLTVYLDRIRIQPAASGRTASGKAFVDEEVNTIIQPHSVAGIEVYPRFGGAPPNFSIAAGTCGLVLVWSK